MGSGKAELEAESKPRLEQQAALRVFIGGHTDNQGGADANVALSQQLALAVVGALVKDFGIDAKRLGAKGAASLRRWLAMGVRRSGGGIGGWRWWCSRRIRR
jgi:outer membrane protein OmpA-like peptidoglycan-associated protein